MAYVNVDLSEYDMLREAKAKAESQVKELTEEVRKLKENTSNVVVKNRYYVASLDYRAAASKIIQALGYEGLTQLVQAAQDMRWSACNDPFGRPSINQELVRQVGGILEYNLKDLLNLRNGYIEDTTTVEVRGFDELSDNIKAKIEAQYRSSFQEKEATLDRQIEAYNLKHLDVDKAVKQAEKTLRESYEGKLKKANTEIGSLNEKVNELQAKLREASKTSEEKLAEAMTNLAAAQAEVAKYQKPKRRGFLGIWQS